MKTRSLLLLLLFLLACATRAAEVKSGQDPMMGRREQAMLRGLDRSNLGLSTNVRKGRALLVLTVGASYGNLLLLTNGVSDPRSTANALARVSEGILSDATYLYGEDDGLGVVKGSWSDGHFGQDSGSSQVAIGALARALRAEGFDLGVAARFPLYSTEKVPGTAAPFESPNFRYYDGSSWPVESVVSVQAKVPPFALAGLFAMVLFPGFSALAALAAGVIVGRQSRIPLARRRKLYGKLVLGGTYGSIFIHMPIFLILLLSGWSRPITDVWFGGTSATLIPFVMLPMLPIFGMLLLNGMVERKLFGPANPTTQQDVPVPEVTEEEKRLRKRIAIVQLVAILALVGLTWWLPDGSRFAFPIILISIQLVPFLVRRFFAKSLAAYERKEEDPKITAMAEEIAGKANVRLKRVFVSVDPASNRSANASMNLSGNLTITARAREVMSDQEMKTLLAHEIAHLQFRHVGRRTRVSLASVALMFVPMMSIVSFAPVLPRWAFYLLICCPMAGVALMLYGTNRLARTFEREADERALELTRDYVSTESALIKLARNGPMPYMHDVNDFSTHPTLSRRLKYLRTHAEKLKIPLTPATPNLEVALG